MASIVDSLTVTLGLDASGFKKGQQQTREDLKATAAEAERTAKLMQARGKQAAEFFSAVQTSVVSLVGVFTGIKTVEGFANIARGVTQLSFAAANAGVNLQTQSAFSLAIARNGGNAEAAADSFQRLALAIEDARLHGGPLQGTLSIFGAQLNDPIITIFSKLESYIEKVKNLPNGRALILQALSGLNLDPATFNALLAIGSPAALNREMAAAGGVAATDQQASNLVELNKAVTRFEQSAENLGRVFTNLVSGPLTRILNYLADAIKPPSDSDIDAARKADAEWWASHPNGGTFEDLRPALTRMGVLGSDTYNPGVGPDAWTAARPTVPTGSSGERASWQQIHDYFVSQGWSDAAAGGLADNAMLESGGKVGEVNPAGGGTGARGMFQWRGDRTENFRRMFGHTPDQGTVAENLAFAQWELTVGPERGAGRMIRSAQTRAQATALTRQYYERPGGVGGVGGGGTTSLSVGQITINTQATDAAGIARDINGALVSQANRGLN